MPIRDLVTILYFSCQSTRLAVERFTVSRTILDGMVRTWSQGRSETLGEVSRSEVLNSTPNPVITPFSLAGFGARRPHAPGGLTAIPAAVR